MIRKLSEIKSLGRYKLLHELGRGGMSVVYLANDTELDRNVAIKCVSTLDASSTKLVDHLRTEAKLLAQLNHPNIVQLYDVVEQNDILGLVIEYVGGQTLTQRLKQSPDRATKLKWLAEIAEGLSMAHARGIAHCDLKAENVLVSTENIAKVADFGIAKVKLNDYLEDDGLTRVENVSGSYFSLSPEQATGNPVDSRTDLFSFAILMFQCLVGKHPFGETNNKIALLQRVINDPISIDDESQAILGPRLVELISNLVNKNPDARLYNASEAAELIRSEFNAAYNQSTSDATIEIPIQTTESTQQNTQSNGNDQRRGITKSLLLIALGFGVGLGLIKAYDYYFTAEKNIHYVALDEIEIETTNDFNQELLQLIESTLKESAEQAIVSLSDTNLISTREFLSVKGNYSKKAKATGADSIVRISADCNTSKCDLKLRKHVGNKMAVEQQKSWPVAVQSLTGIRTAVSDEISSFYYKSSTVDQRPAIPEDSYRAYITIFLETENGKKSKPEHLSRLSKLIDKQPFFAPAYGLATRVAERLHSQFGNSLYLSQLEEIVTSAPRSLNEDAQLFNAKISLALLKGEIEEAKNHFLIAQQAIDDKAVLTNLETDIAYYGNNPENLLALDKRNATLRPSAKTFYNLATSEYSFGNYDATQTALDSALALYPNYSFALSLKATIQMRQGSLSEAINNFNTAITENPSGTNYSNLGLAYLLAQDYVSAIEQFKFAISTSPAKTTFHLNIADSYKLNRQKDLADHHYDRVIELTSAPSKASEFRQRAQALAQRGNFISAIKTLNTAVKKYPSDANLKHASAIVYTLSSNYVVAAVAVEESVTQGTGRVWFSLPWFKPLCNTESFKKLTYPETQPLCES